MGRASDSPAPWDLVLPARAHSAVGVQVVAPGIGDEGAASDVDVVVLEFAEEPWSLR